jgi:hypothetical protein
MEYYDPNAVRASYLQGQQGYMSQMGALSQRYGNEATTQFGYQQDTMDEAGDYLQQAQGLMSGDSPILDAMKREQAQQLADMGGQQANQMASSLAARGMGGGGLSALQSSITGNRMGEEARKGLLGIQQYGLTAGQGFGQLGQGLLGQANQMGALGFQGLGGEQSAAGDVASLQHQANVAATQQQAANIDMRNRTALAKQARRKSMWGNVAKGVGAAVAFSDIAIKDNIEYLYDSPDGHKVYSFNYKGVDTKYKGVMAQDLLKTNPKAVSEIDGILSVDYSQIDVDMEKIEGSG